MTAETAISIASTIVAFAALIFSIRSFNHQQNRAEVYARASVKPLLSIRSQAYTDLKSILLINYGIGPAIIKKAEFRRGPEGQPTNKIVELFDLKIVWESFVNVVPNRAIPSEGEIVLIKQSLSHLQSQGYTEGEAQSLLHQWQQQKTGIVVRIEYEDIFGNQLPVLEETLA